MDDARLWTTCGCILAESCSLPTVISRFDCQRCSVGCWHVLDHGPHRRHLHGCRSRAAGRALPGARRRHLHPGRAVGGRAARPAHGRRRGPAARPDRRGRPGPRRGGGADRGGRSCGVRAGADRGDLRVDEAVPRGRGRALPAVRDRVGGAGAGPARRRRPRRPSAALRVALRCAQRRQGPRAHPRHPRRGQAPPRRRARPAHLRSPRPAPAAGRAPTPSRSSSRRSPGCGSCSTPTGSARPSSTPTPSSP